VLFTRPTEATLFVAGVNLSNLLMGYTSGGSILPNKAIKPNRTNSTHHEMKAPFVNIGLRRNIIRTNHTRNSGNKTPMIEEYQGVSQLDFLQYKHMPYLLWLSQSD